MGFPELIHSQYIVPVDDPITHLQKKMMDLPIPWLNA